MEGGIWLWAPRLVQVGRWTSSRRITHNSSHRPGRHVAALWYWVFIFTQPHLSQYVKCFHIPQLRMPMGLQSWNGKSLNQTLRRQHDSVVYVSQLKSVELNLTLDMISYKTIPRPACSRGAIGGGFHICDTTAGQCWADQRRVSNRAQRGTVRLHCRLHR